MVKEQKVVHLVGQVGASVERCRMNDSVRLHGTRDLPVRWVLCTTCSFVRSFVRLATVAMTRAFFWAAEAAANYRLTGWVFAQGASAASGSFRPWSSLASNRTEAGLRNVAERRRAAWYAPRVPSHAAWWIVCSRRLHFQAGVAMIPHPNKRQRGGEDAFFLTKRAAGVFDGVGGWSALGVDPGLYSRRLAELVRAGTESMDASGSLVSVLDQAAASNDVVGSCTACLVALSTPLESAEVVSRRGTLTCVNLGDSGLLVMRKGDVIFRSKEQQHYFNCPYQLGSQSKDTAYDAFVDRFEVQAGDWFVLGTDGLFDNVYDKEIVDCIQDWYRERTEKKAAATDVPPAERSRANAVIKSTLKSEPDGHARREMHIATESNTCAPAPAMIVDGAPVLQDLATRLAQMAVTLAADENRMSPFAVNARSAGFWYYGGKADDVTVVVGRIVRSTS